MMNGSYFIFPVVVVASQILFDTIRRSQDYFFLLNPSVNNRFDISATAVKSVILAISIPLTACRSFFVPVNNNAEKEPKRLIISRPSYTALFPW